MLYIYVIYMFLYVFVYCVCGYYVYTCRSICRSTRVNENFEFSFINFKSLDNVHFFENLFFYKKNSSQIL